MKHVTYADKSLLLDDRSADLLTEYAAALGDNNKADNVTVAAGQTLQFGTCTLAGATGSGDTYLRLYTSTGTQVGASDNACGSLSYLRYTVPAGAGGTYQLRAGCAANRSCGGTVVYTLQ